MTALQISSDIKYHLHSSARLPVYAIKYEAFLCSLQCGGNGRCLTCDGLYQPPTDAWCTSRLQVVLCLSAPTSLASIMAIGLHHTAVTHVGDSSEVSQREHMARLSIHRKCWSEFLCLV
jgi:hypothetical protein